MGVVIRSVSITIIGLSGLIIMGRAAEFKGIDLKSAVVLIAGGLFAGFFGQFTYYSALKAGDASAVVPIAAAYPLITLIISVIFLHEAFTLSKAAGIVMIVGGIVLLR